jgi:hypothetical protein
MVNVEPPMTLLVPDSDGTTTSGSGSVASSEPDRSPGIGTETATAVSGLSSEGAV